MSLTHADLEFATKLPALSDEELLQTWRAAVTAGVKQRITLAETAAVDGGVNPRKSGDDRKSGA